MMFALDFHSRDGTENMSVYELLKLVEILKKNGVIMEWSYIKNITSCLVIFLPFIITEEQMQELVIRMKKSFGRILR